MNLNKSYLNFCKKKNFEININQLDLVKELNNFYNINFNKSFLKKIFNQKKSKLGFYLQGDVGVGKTMICNEFYQHLEIKKKKTHFNKFMIEVHDFLQQNQN